MLNHKVIALQANGRLTYPDYYPKARKLRDNTLLPRADKGTRYVFDRKGTRRVAGVQ